jgi:hypothetical protein
LFGDIWIKLGLKILVILIAEIKAWYNGLVLIGPVMAHEVATR